MSCRLSIKNGYVDIKPKRHRRTKKEIEGQNEIAMVQMRELLEEHKNPADIAEMSDEEVIGLYKEMLENEK